MSAEDDLTALAEISGILPNFYDLQGNLRPTSPETKKALLTGNGFDVSSDAAIGETLAAERHDSADRWFPKEIIVQTGRVAPQQFGLGAEWHICLDQSKDVIASARGRPVWSQSRSEQRPWLSKNRHQTQAVEW